jgi:hypothetical protein
MCIYWMFDSRSADRQCILDGVELVALRGHRAGFTLSFRTDFCLRSSVRKIALSDAHRLDRFRGAQD